MIKLNKGSIKIAFFTFLWPKGQIKVFLFSKPQTGQFNTWYLNIHVTFKQSTCINYKAVLCLTCTA